jgi:hypothetical protein
LTQEALPRSFRDPGCTRELNVARSDHVPQYTPAGSTERSRSASFLMTTSLSVWRWATGRADHRAGARLLTRRQFERRAKHQLAGAQGLPGALLFIGLEGLTDAERIIGRRECEHIIHRLCELVMTIAAGCPAVLITRDALLVYVQDMTRSVDIAETVRIAAQQEFTADRLKVLAGNDQVRSAEMTGKHLLTVTAGTCAFAPHQDFEEAVRRTEDALLKAKQGRGPRGLLNSSR